jgi:hypothetical protein
VASTATEAKRRTTENSSYCLGRERFLKLKPIRRRSLALLGITTGIVIWGGQTYVWNPFLLYYQAYPWYAMFWAMTLTWLVPRRMRHVKVMLETPGLETLQEPEDAI